jgi:metal-sulfur cluster biosynthetic enzyme
MEAAQVWQALRQVIDPELGINIVDLGLVYDVQVNDGQVRVAMTMTTPACPLHTYLTSMAESAIWQNGADVKAVEVQVVWTPLWNPMMMTDAAKQQLGWEMAK